MTARDVHTIRHGYNLADLERLTRASIWHTYAASLPFDERYDIAWSSIVERLYAADQRPEPSDLVAAAKAAISKTIYDDWHHRGWDYNTHRGEMGRFAAYWSLMRVASDPGPGVVDRTALWQIWPLLTDRQREVLLALATHDNYTVAAAACGMSYGAFKQRVTQARHAFLRLWHEGEQPSRPWGTDRRQGAKNRSVASLLVKRERHRRERAA